MILLIDNYDSFTYNLVQYLGELGAKVRVVRNDKIDAAQVSKMRPKGIVLSPGPGRPEHAGNMNSIIEKHAGRVPMFGVCLGHQGIAQVFGAKITYAPSLMHGKTSPIFHKNSAMFKGVGSPFTATRYHSLVVDPAIIPKGFKLTAWTEDKVVMALENRRRKLFGVQFHPESILTEAGKKILSNFLEICRGNKSAQ